MENVRILLPRMQTTVLEGGELDAKSVKRASDQIVETVTFAKT
jgi:hypothetical protein